MSMWFGSGPSFGADAKEKGKWTLPCAWHLAADQKFWRAWLSAFAGDRIGFGLDTGVLMGVRDRYERRDGSRRVKLATWDGG